MASRIFWVLAAVFFGFSLLVFAVGADGAGSVTDYRAWLLLAGGVAAAIIGNVAHTIGHGQ